MVTLEPRSRPGLFLAEGAGLAELANGVVRTETAIRWCREILDDLQEPKTVGMQAVVKAIRDLLPKLEEDLKALGKAYTRATKRKP